MSKQIHVHLTPELLAHIANLVERGEYTSAAEALRSGFRLIIQEYGESIQKYGENRGR